VDVRTTPTGPAGPPAGNRKTETVGRYTSGVARTAINLYTVRDLDEPILRTLERVADAGYDGVQFSGGFGDADVETVATALDDLGLDATGAHVGIDDLEADPAGVTDTYRRIGVDAVVVPYLPAEHFEAPAAVAETADRFDALADRLDAGLHYHNHAHELVDIDGTNGFEAFADASSVGLEIDVGWVLTAGHDPAALVDRYADRIDLLHMKDMADGEFREIGDGDVDMAACASAARAAGASWLIYEHDEPSDPVASLEHGAAFLDSL
jgi:sugar phosphate isomerase/epimerase